MLSFSDIHMYIFNDKVKEQLPLSLRKVNDLWDCCGLFIRFRNAAIHISHVLLFSLLISTYSGEFFEDFFADTSIFQLNRFHVPDFTPYLLDFLLHCKYLSFCVKL